MFLKVRGSKFPYEYGYDEILVNFLQRNLFSLVHSLNIFKLVV
jgi:hypothetical protein